MTSYRKKLIEVALPLEAINKAAAREKSIRHGHPSTLHLWWARRPLAACRAVLFASLVDDPDSDPAYRKPDGTVDEDRAGVKRAELFNLIEQLVQWENSNDPLIIGAARAEIARCIASRKLETGELKKDHKLPGGETVWDLIVKGHGDLRRLRSGHAKLPKAESVNAFLEKHAPPVLDPFCGGGSIPLEAQRLGLRAYGSDLNPVPVLITKALIEIPPKFAGKPPVNPRADKKIVWHGAEGLAEDVRYYGKWMRDEAEKRIGHLYPKVKVTAAMAKGRPDLAPYVGQELTVIAWLWARTVASPNPAVGGAHVPLVRSFWLSTKKGKEAWVRPVIDSSGSSWKFVVGVGKPPADFDPGTGTIGRKGGRCILTGAPMQFPHVRSEGQGGRMKERLMAIVAEGARGRVYLSPNEGHDAIARSVVPSWRPDAALPDNPRDFKTPNYGMRTFADLFTPRQLTALVTFSDLVGEARAKVLADAKVAGTLPADERPLDQDGTGCQAYGDAVATYLAFLVDQLANHQSTICGWNSTNAQMRTVFARQAIPMTWDFAESNVFCESSGSFHVLFDRLVKGITGTAADGPLGRVMQVDAATAGEDDEKCFATDPPYYDNIGYADLSDFFYVWLRRSLGDCYPQVLSTLLTPKARELIAASHRHGGSKDAARKYFEKGLGQVFGRIRREHVATTPLVIFYAFKQTEDEDESGDENDEHIDTATASTGWETMLEGVIGSGFAVTSTWPMRTEKKGRVIGIGTNALASSIVLSCRPRPAEAPLATRREFLNALKRELPDSLKNLQRGNIAPVDLAQAAIGPGMAVFTRYAKVMETDGSAMTVRTALGLINQALDEVLAEQEGEFDADTRWALAWFEQFGMEEGPFGVAETLSKAKNTAVNGLVEAGIVKARAGKVRLLERDELPADWDPATDKRLTIWEVTQYLIRALDKEGESGAAALLRKLGGTAEIARDLAYRLYTICERKKWADEALAYNGLVIAWPELSRLAVRPPEAPKPVEKELF